MMANAPAECGKRQEEGEKLRVRQQHAAAQAAVNGKLTALECALLELYLRLRRGDVWNYLANDSAFIMVESRLRDAAIARLSPSKLAELGICTPAEDQAPDKKQRRMAFIRRACDAHAERGAATTGSQSSMSDSTTSPRSSARHSASSHAAAAPVSPPHKNQHDAAPLHTGLCASGAASEGRTRTRRGHERHTSDAFNRAPAPLRLRAQRSCSEQNDDRQILMHECAPALSNHAAQAAAQQAPPHGRAAHLDRVLHPCVAAQLHADAEHGMVEAPVAWHGSIARAVALSSAEAQHTPATLVPRRVASQDQAAPIQDEDASVEGAAHCLDCAAVAPSSTASGDAERRAGRRRDKERCARAGGSARLRGEERAAALPLPPAAAQHGAQGSAGVSVTAVDVVVPALAALRVDAPAPQASDGGTAGGRSSLEAALARIEALGAGESNKENDHFRVARNKAPGPLPSAQFVTHEQLARQRAALERTWSQHELDSLVATRTTTVKGREQVTLVPAPGLFALVRAYPTAWLPLLALLLVCASESQCTHIARLDTGAAPRAAAGQRTVLLMPKAVKEDKLLPMVEPVTAVATVLRDGLHAMGGPGEVVDELKALQTYHKSTIALCAPELVALGLASPITRAELTSNARVLLALRAAWQCACGLALPIAFAALWDGVREALRQDGKSVNKELVCIKAAKEVLRGLAVQAHRQARR